MKRVRGQDCILEDDEEPPSLWRRWRKDHEAVAKWVSARRPIHTDFARLPDLLAGRDGSPVDDGDIVIVVPSSFGFWHPEYSMQVVTVDYFHGFKSDGEMKSAMAQCFDKHFNESNFYDFEMVACRTWPRTWLFRRISRLQRAWRWKSVMRHLTCACGGFLDAWTLRNIAEFLC